MIYPIINKKELPEPYQTETIRVYDSERDRGLLESSIKLRTTSLFEEFFADLWERHRELSMKEFMKQEIEGKDRLLVLTDPILATQYHAASRQMNTVKISHNLRLRGYIFLMKESETNGLLLYSTEEPYIDPHPNGDAWCVNLNYRIREEAAEHVSVFKITQ